MCIVKRIAQILILLIIAALIVGLVYQRIGVYRDSKNYVPVGELYDIGSNKLHIYTGGSGNVTIVFAAGWGTVNPYADFFPLYKEISKHAKFVVYDRPGYGYSDITGKNRDIDTMVDEIHKLLNKSGQKPPYVLVGHSLASLETIRYAQKYKDEVKGIVLIDAGNPELYVERKPVTFIGIVQRQLINFGAARLLYNSDGFAESINSERNGLVLLPEDIKDLDRTATLLKANNKDIIDEMRNSQENAKKVITGGKLGDIPLTIISSGQFGNQDAGWLESQIKFKEWSNNSKQFVVQDTKHYIHHYKPKIIIEEILTIINGI